MIIVISGPPSSGKSTLGGLLAAGRNITHLEMDAFRVRLLPEAAHTREDRQIAYRAMHYTAELLVERGHSVIVNASYSHSENRREIEEIASRREVALFLVECKVSPEIAVERSRERRGSHPGLDLTDERVIDLVTGFPFFGEGLTLDSTTEIADCLRRIEEYLAAGIPLSPGRWSTAGSAGSTR
jgi:predicted kinase